MSQIKTIITAKDNASGVFSNFGGTVTSLNQGLELTKKVMGALTAPFKAVVAEGKAFEQQMANVKSISKTTAAEFKKLETEAKRIGATTSFSATQAGQAMEALRRTGQSTNQIIKTTAQVMDLAAAQGLELGRAADVVAVQMNIFKKENLTAQAAVDLMNKTVGASPQEFGNLASALEASAGTAAGFGVKFETVTQILGAMAEAGVKGEKAGTALNAVFARLAAPTTEVSKALEKYGITMEQVNPATNSFASIVELLNQKNVKQADLFKILGQEAAPKFFDVISKGGAAITGFAEKQREANTAAQSAADRMNTLEGKTKLFDSALSALKIEVFDQIKTGLAAIVEGATAFIGKTQEFVAVNNIFGKMKKSIGFLLIGFAGILDIFIQIAKSKTVTAIFDALRKAFDGIGNAIGPLVVAFKSFVGEVFSSIEKNDKLREVLSRIVEIGGKVATIVVKIATLLLKVFKPAIGPIIEVVTTLADIITRVLNVGLTGLGAAIDFLFDPLGNLKKGLDAVLTPIRSVAGAVSGFFTKAMDAAADSVKKFDDELWLNSLGPSLIDLIKPLETVRDKAKALGEEFLKDTKATKALDDQLKKTGVTATKAGAGGGAGTGVASKGTPSQITLANLGKGAVGGAEKIGSQITGVGGAIQGFQQGGPIGAIGGFVTEMLLSNEKFREGLEKVSEVMVKLFAPIAEALIPILDAIAELMIELAPVFKIIADILKPIAQGLATIIKTIGPVLKILGNILSSIFTTLKPLLDGLAALFQPLLIPLIIAFGLLNSLIAPLTSIMQTLIDAFQPLIDAINAIASIIPGGRGGGANSFLNLSGASGIAGLFSSGGVVTPDRMITKPDSTGHGLISAAVGETVLPTGPNANGGYGATISITIGSIDSSSRIEELRQTLEELFLSGRLKVA